MKKNELHWLNKILGKQKIYILILLIIQAILGASSVFYALLFRNVLDAAANTDQHKFWQSIGLLIGLVAVQISLRAIDRSITEYANATYENRLKGRLFQTLLHKNYASVTAIHSGEWQNRLTADTVVVSDGLVQILPGIVGMMVKLIGALVMILVLEPKFGFILIPGGLAVLGLTYAFRKVMKRLHKNIQETNGKLRIFLQERLGNLMIVRAFSAEQQTQNDADFLMNEHRKARMKRNRVSNISNIGFAVAMNGMYLLGLGWCGYGIMHGTVSYGTLMAILQLIAQIQSPFANITGYLPKYYAMLASAERLMEAEHFSEDFEDELMSMNSVRTFYETELDQFVLEQANFTYLPPAQDLNSHFEPTKQQMSIVLNNSNLSLKKGEFVAFTGQSGCGKSTVLKLLMCLYELDSGRRFMKKRDGSSILLTSEWHRLFAYVPQGNQLMSGSIREIITYADHTQMHDDKRIRQALHIACEENFVYALDKGVDTVLGERGQGLSEGQMQRIAIARAIFSEHPVLILDESTSALDSDTEQKLLENLRTLTNKTVLIVTHRPAVFAICDRVINFTENGLGVKCIGK